MISNYFEFTKIPDVKYPKLDFPKYQFPLAPDCSDIAKANFTKPLCTLKFESIFKVCDLRKPGRYLYESSLYPSTVNYYLTIPPLLRVALGYSCMWILQV